MCCVPHLAFFIKEHAMMSHNLVGAAPAAGCSALASASFALGEPGGSPDTYPMFESSVDTVYVCMCILHI